MIGCIHTGIFFLGKMRIERGLYAQIKSIGSNDAFCLMATGGQQYKAVITASYLLIRKINASPSVFLAHAKTLESGIADYPIRRVICKSLTVLVVYLNDSH